MPRQDVSHPPRQRIPAAALVIAGVFGLEGGATLATSVIAQAGVAGTVALRLGFGAVGLLIVARPHRRAWSMATGRRAAAVGLLLAAHHVCFYAAIHRLPLGVAVTLEFVGPLVVALVGSRRLTDLAWACLAGVGVVATAGISAPGRINAVGIVLALAAGASWATYIVVFPRLASRVGRADALALATLAGAVVAVPVGAALAGARMASVHVLLLGAAVAFLADVVAYSLQAEALGRISPSLFSVLTSTEPAAGALLGLIALGQAITAVQWTGIALVSVAAIGASRAAAETTG
jgi:inner membrane transporter RhtA